MGIIRKESIRSTIFSYIGIVIGFISQTFIYTNLLSAQIIGLIRVLQSFGGMQSEVSQLSIQTITSRFFPYFRDKEKGHHGFITMALLFTTAGFIVVFILIMIFRGTIINWYADQSELFVKKYHYAFPIALALVYTTVFESYLKMLYRIIYTTIVKEIYLRLFALGAVLLYAFDIIGLEGFLIMYSASFAIVALLLVIYLKAIGELHLKPDFSILTKSFWQEIKTYTIYTYITILVHRGILEIDKLILAAKSGLGATGIYSVASLMATVIAMPINSISNISVSFFSEAFKSKDMEKVKEIYHKTTLNQFIASALLFLIIWFNADNLFSFMPEEYQQGKWIIFFIGVSKLIDSFSISSNSVILLSKYYMFMVFSGTLTLAFLIAANIYLINVMGITGAAVAILLSVILHDALKVGYTWYKFNIHPFNKNLFMAFGVFLLCTLIFSLIPNIKLVIPDILLRSVSITVIYLLAVHKLKISEDISKLINELLILIKAKYYKLINKRKNE